ncbi:hypothetical protein BN9982_450005 [Mycobacterium tuberculosis]|nr:hypothetical protein BN9982_450005 [Mycobacterium tuberculosis]
MRAAHRLLPLRWVTVYSDDPCRSTPGRRRKPHQHWWNVVHTAPGVLPSSCGSRRNPRGRELFRQAAQIALLLTTKQNPSMGPMWLMWLNLVEQTRIPRRASQASLRRCDDTGVRANSCR